MLASFFAAGWLGLVACGALRPLGAPSACDPALADCAGATDTAAPPDPSTGPTPPTTGTSPTATTPSTTTGGTTQPPAPDADLVDWVVKILFCDRPPPHLAHEVLTDVGHGDQVPGGDQVVNGSKRALSDKWNEVHYVIEVVLPIACCR